MGKRTVQFFFLTEKWTQRVSIFTSPIQVIGLPSMHEGLNVNEASRSSCLYRASVTIKTLYYPTDAQIYNS